MTSPMFMLVDGHNVAYRAYYALPPLSAPDGRPTHAVLGFIRQLEHWVTQWNPSHLCVAFDGGLPAARMAALETYKAQRKPMPPDLRTQLPLMERYLDCARVAHLRVEGQEADDLIGALAHRAARDGARVRIITSDKDLLQLATDQIRLVSPAAPAEDLGPDEVLRKTGVPPDRIVDWLALTGDTADNIPGVPGIGGKTATNLLVQFGSLDQLEARVEEVKSERIRQAVKANWPVIRRNQEMMRLQVEAEPPLAWDHCRRTPADTPALTRFYTELGFHQLVRRAQQPELF